MIYRKFLTCTLIVCALFFSSAARTVAAGFQDGGKLQGQDSQCSCSGGQTIKVLSYVDHANHVYLYQPGVTRLYSNYNITQSGPYFLATLLPVAVCLDSSEECEGSSGQQPEGIFLMTGTSLSSDLKSTLALINAIPGFPELSKKLALLFRTSFPKGGLRL